MPATSPDAGADGGAAARAARRGFGIAAAASLAGLTGCSWLSAPNPAPMAALYDDRACPRTQAPVLLVLLPGVYMATDELVRQGFVTALRQRGIGADVLVADAHLGYVQDRSVLRRLHDDVVAPARASGYRRVWLAGISLGGYVALAYAMERTGEVEGVVALAPYLGSAGLVAEIAAAGGAAAWSRSAAAQAPGSGDADRLDRRLWRWLAADPRRTPPLWLGHGSDDRFAAAHRLLAATLPVDRVATAPGGHDWAPWRALWSRWLDRGLLPAGCGGTP